MVMVRDRATRARVAYSLLEATLLPKAQVSFEVQFITLDSEKMYHYGLALPTSFPYTSFGNLGGLHSILPKFPEGLKFLTFGGGASLVGFGLADSTVFATYSNSFSHNLYNATVVVADRQTANFHVGDQYPIPQAISGASTRSSSIYNPIGQVNFVDLGVILKLTPKIGSDGSIGIDVEADYKALGNQTFNTVPSVLQREFKGQYNRSRRRVGHCYRIGFRYSEHHPKWNCRAFSSQGAQSISEREHARYPDQQHARGD